LTYSVFYMAVTMTCLWNSVSYVYEVKNKKKLCGGTKKKEE